MLCWKKIEFFHIKIAEKRIQARLQSSSTSLSEEKKTHRVRERQTNEKFKPKLIKIVIFCYPLLHIAVVQTEIKFQCGLFPLLHGGGKLLYLIDLFYKRKKSMFN